MIKDRVIKMEEKNKCFKKIVCLIICCKLKNINMATKITPTFLLKGIDPQKIISDYQAGVFSKPVQAKQKIKIPQNKTILAQSYGSSNHDAIFCIKDKNNCSIIVATSGHEDYQLYTRNGGALPKGGRCEFCREDFTDIALGYPVGFSETTLLTNDDSDINNARYRNFYNFWVEGHFCSFECALGFVQMILSKPFDRDNTLLDSEFLLKLLFKLMHPNGILREAQDPRLLKVNGGSLTKEQWQDKKHIYVRTERILMIPAKVEYNQQNYMSAVVAEPINNNSILLT
jgi:hypothetical protein